MLKFKPIGAELLRFLKRTHPVTNRFILFDDNLLLLAYLATVASLNNQLTTKELLYSALITANTGALSFSLLIRSDWAVILQDYGKISRRIGGFTYTLRHED